MRVRLPALAAAVGFLAREGGEEARLDVGEGGGEALVAINEAKLGLDPGGAADRLEEGVGGESQEGLGVEPPQGAQDVLAPFSRCRNWGCHKE